MRLEDAASEAGDLNREVTLDIRGTSYAVVVLGGGGAVVTELTIAIIAPSIDITIFVESHTMVVACRYVYDSWAVSESTTGYTGDSDRKMALDIGETGDAVVIDGGGGHIVAELAGSIIPPSVYVAVFV